MTREKYAEKLSIEILEQAKLLRSLIDSMSNTLSHYVITIVDSYEDKSETSVYSGTLFQYMLKEICHFINKFSSNSTDLVKSTPSLFGDTYYNYSVVLFKIHIFNNIAMVSPIDASIDDTYFQYTYTANIFNISPLKDSNTDMVVTPNKSYETDAELWGALSEIAKYLNQIWINYLKYQKTYTGRNGGIPNVLYNKLHQMCNEVLDIDEIDDFIEYINNYNKREENR